MPDESNSDYNPEESPEEDFYRFLRDSEGKLEAEAKSMPKPETSTEQAMMVHLQSTMMDILSELRSKREPDQVFAAAMQGLSKMQQEQFILENILESLKRGDNLDVIMKRLEGLGLASTRQDPPLPQADIPKEDDPEPYIGPGNFLMQVLKKVGKSSMILTKVALKAARVAKGAGKFVEIVPIIGFVGPVPSVSLQLQPKGVAVDELIDLVMEILE